LVGSISVATELLGKVSSIQAAKTILKGESAEKRDSSQIPVRARAREDSRFQSERERENSN
jgi:hypothetical protein